MAELTYYVDTDVSGGLGDGSSWANAYASLNACLTAEATNLVGSGNNVVVLCRASNGTADTIQASTAGWGCSYNTGETLEIRCADTIGYSWNDTIYRMSNSNMTYSLRNTLSGVIVNGLQMEVAAINANYQHCLDLFGFLSNNPIEVKNCLFKSANQSTYRERLVYLELAGGRVVYMYNNVFYNMGDAAHFASCPLTLSNQGTVNMYRNVFDGGEYNVYYPVIGSGATLAYNNIFTGGNLGISQNAIDWDGSSDYNSTDQSSGVDSGGNTRTSQTFTFVDENNGNFYLDPTDTGAKGYGTDLSGATPSVTIDRLGETLESPFDIGAYQFLGGVIVPFNILRPLGSL